MLNISFGVYHQKIFDNNQFQNKERNKLRKYLNLRFYQPQKNIFRTFQLTGKKIEEFTFFFLNIKRDQLTANSNTQFNIFSFSLIRMRQ